MYQAIDSVTNELVAIKAQRIDRDDAAREIATYETLRAFPHPNICRMVDRFVVSDAGRKELRLVFDYHPSNIMKLALRTPEGRNGVVPRSMVVHYLGGIVDALIHIHDTIGIAHGDLSLGNILIGFDNTIKLGDFGTAHCAHTYICTEPMATYYVRSPEQWAESPNCILFC